ncbi:MAG: hypothetical protein RLN62_02905 [Rickettsiales bacterium]
MKFFKFGLIIWFAALTSAAEIVENDYVIQQPPTEFKHNFLPDGTEIQMEGDKIYYVCKYKLKPLDKGLYMLADGTVIKVKNGKVVSDRQRYQRPTEKKRKKRAEQDEAKKDEPKEKLMPQISVDKS